jgi:hypothetical protein
MLLTKISLCVNKIIYKTNHKVIYFSLYRIEFQKLGNVNLNNEYKKIKINLNSNRNKLQDEDEKN